MRIVLQVGTLIVLLSPCFMPAYGQKKAEKALNDTIKSFQKEIDTKNSEITKQSKNIDSLGIVIARLQDSLKACKNEIPLKDPLGELESTIIIDQAWAIRNLNEVEVRHLIPNIYLADSLERWNAFCTNKQPAYCYHRADTGKKFGVLLNIPALEVIQKMFEGSMNGWHLPNAEDIGHLSQNINKRSNFFQSLVSSSAASATLKWKKSGNDFFGMNLVPLSFRLNDNRQWYGGDEASFFCYDPAIKVINEKLTISILDEGLQDFYVSQKDLTEDFFHYGVYVRLIKNSGSKN